MPGALTPVEPAIERILIGRDRIADRVAELAAALAEELDALEPAPIVVLPILTGSIVFVADLIRHLPGRFRVETLTARSYHGATTKSSGAPIISELPATVAGAHVVIVDDILDSGTTLARIRDLIADAGPASQRACVLLRKRVPGGMDAACEHVGFEVDDVFVVGYGLDFDGYYRNLPDLAVLKAPS